MMAMANPGAPIAALRGGDPEDGSGLARSPHPLRSPHRMARRRHRRRPGRAVADHAGRWGRHGGHAPRRATGFVIEAEPAGRSHLPRRPFPDWSERRPHLVSRPDGAQCRRRGGTCIERASTGRARRPG